MGISQIDFLDIEENDDYEKIIETVLQKCYETENINNKLYVNVILTNSRNIREKNKEHRKIDKETDVLSFPMFEKEELVGIQIENFDFLGDIVISIEKVEEQAKEYGHSVERELAYMVTHSFYHLIGYDHIDENDKKEMREKEEFILQDLKIRRN